MKKLIFCVHGFPGNGGGGTFNLIKYLPRYGYEPIVITNGHKITEMEKRLLSEHFPAGLRLYRTATLPKSPFRLFSKFFGLPKLAAFLDKFVFFPDFNIVSVPAAVLKAISLIRSEKIDCIITSSPPESYHLIGLIAQKRTGCRWVAHFRDLWTTKAIVNKPATPFHASFVEKLEKLVYSRTDHMIANTRGNRDIYKRTFNISPNRMTHVPNGFDAEEVPDCAPVSSSSVPRVFRIGYMGYFDKPGFPWSEFLLAVKKLVAAFGEETVEFLIVGHASPAVTAFVAKHGMGGFVKLHGELTHSDAFAMMLQTELVVVLHYETGYSKAIVPHKLYHYLGMRKTVLGVGDEDGEMACIIREANAGCVISLSKPDGIFDELSAYYREWKTNGRLEYHGVDDIIDHFEIQNLTAKLAGAITKTIVQDKLI